MNSIGFEFVEVTCLYSLFFNRALALTPFMTRRSTLDEVFTTGRESCLCWKQSKRREVFLNLMNLSSNISVALTFRY